jgi:PAS domain-containing protein
MRKPDEASATKTAVASSVTSSEASKLRRLVNTFPVPLFCKKRDGRYLLVNRAFEEFFGFI